MMGTPGLASFAVFIGENPMNIVHAFISVGIGFVITFILTWFLGFEDEVSEESKEQSTSLVNKIEVASPADGQLIKLSEVKDETFAAEILGKGGAVIPANGKVTSPANGKILNVFPTKHAISLVDENGAEILIHIGIDTVKLDGNYFTSYVQEGDFVKKGDLLVEFDKKSVEAEGFDTTIVVLVTNTEDFLNVVPANAGDVKAQQTMFTIV